MFTENGNNDNWRLTLSWRRPLSYRNQSIDLRSKSMDWFLYDNGLCHERVKVLNFRHGSVQNNGPVKYIVHIVIHCRKVSLFLYFRKELTQNQLDFWNLHYRFLIVVDYIKFQKISSSSRGKFEKCPNSPKDQYSNACNSLKNCLKNVFVTKMIIWRKIQVTGTKFN